MRLLFLLITCCSLFATDHRYSGTVHPRHKEMREVLVNNETKMENRYLTGSWQGARRWLAEQGVTITSSFTTDMVGNPIGGRARGFSYAGSLGADLLFDFSKLTSLEGWAFYGSVVWRTGTNLSARKIDNQFPVQQVYGSQTVKLNSLYLQKTAFDDRFLLRFGRLNGGDTFLQSDFFYNYVNNAFDGNPISVFFNTPFTAYPNAVWGAYLRFNPQTRIEAKFGAYQGNQRINENRFHGINFTLSAPQGVLYATEWTYLNNQHQTSGLPGNYKLGFFYFTKGGQNLTTNKRTSNTTFYIQLDQMLYRENHSKQGLTAFTTFVFAPEKRNLLPFFFVSGLVYKGLIPCRNEDMTALGAAFGEYSSTLRTIQQDTDQPQQYYELVLELNHNFQITPYFFFQPDLQYIIHPKGFKHIENAWVLGFQSKIVF